MSKQNASTASQAGSAPADQEEALNLDPAAAAVRIILRRQASKLSPRATGQITYEVGVDPRFLPKGDLGKNKNWALPEVYIRLTANDSSGYFSDEWVSFHRIQSRLEELPSVPFKAKVFEPLFVRRGANNHGFLAAVLKHEKLLIADDDKPLILKAAEDGQWQTWLGQLRQQLACSQALEDQIALRYAKKAEEAKERLIKYAALREAKQKERQQDASHLARPELDAAEVAATSNN